MPDVTPYRRFRRVLVTGPQRSGTRIAGKVLAHELGRRYVDEGDVAIRSLAALFRVLADPAPCVVQGPAFSSVCHLIDAPETCVVFMRRDPAAVRRSQERVGWDRGATELRMYFADQGEPAAVKYAAWEKYQRPHMLVPWFELEYEALRGHPLWIDEGERRHFLSAQTRRTWP